MIAVGANTLKDVMIEAVQMCGRISAKIVTNKPGWELNISIVKIKVMLYFVGKDLVIGS